MSTSERIRARTLEVTDRDLIFVLEDGSRHELPIALFPILADATPEERARWEWSADQTAVHWPELDEDISVFSIVCPEHTIGLRPAAALRHIRRNRARGSPHPV